MFKNFYYLRICFFVSGTFSGNTYYQDKWGRTILKRKNSKSIKPPTLGQLSVIGDTRIINTFMAPLKTFALIGFEPEALHTMSNEYNAMVSYNRTNAIQGTYPDRSIDYVFSYNSYTGFITLVSMKLSSKIPKNFNLISIGSISLHHNNIPRIVHYFL